MLSDVRGIALPDKIDHIGVVVKNADKTAGFLSAIWGLASCSTIEYSPRKDDMIAGEPFREKIVYVNLGPVTVELLEPLDRGSLFAQFLQTHGEGIHHMAFTVSNWDETASKLQEQGGRMVLGAVFEGKRWCYFEIKPGDMLMEFMDNFGIHTP